MRRKKDVRREKELKGKRGKKLKERMVAADMKYGNKKRAPRKKYHEKLTCGGGGIRKICKNCDSVEE